MCAFGKRGPMVVTWSDGRVPLPLPLPPPPPQRPTCVHNACVHELDNGRARRPTTFLLTYLLALDNRSRACVGAIVRVGDVCVATSRLLGARF